MRISRDSKFIIIRVNMVIRVVKLFMFVGLAGLIRIILVSSLAFFPFSYLWAVASNRVIRQLGNL